jgi:hypothetical protein
MNAAEKLLLLAAATCLCASCKLNPSVERTGSEPEPPAPPTARPSVATPEPPAPPQQATDDGGAPADAGLSALAGTWYGKIVHGAKSRVVAAQVDPSGSVSLAVGKSEISDGHGETGASSRCTIDGIVEDRGRGWLFVERESKCKGYFALPRRTGVSLPEPCVLQWTDLERRPAGGAMFTLKKPGCGPASKR